MSGQAVAVAMQRAQRSEKNVLQQNLDTGSALSRPVSACRPSSASRHRTPRLTGPSGRPPCVSSSALHVFFFFFWPFRVRLTIFLLIVFDTKLLNEILTAVEILSIELLLAYDEAVEIAIFLELRPPRFLLANLTDGGVADWPCVYPASISLSSSGSAT